MRKGLSGFTIVELLIVIVVIAILATISFVSFNGIRQRADKAAVSVEVSQAAKKILFYTLDQNTPPNTLADAGITNPADGRIVFNYTVNTGVSPSVWCLDGSRGTATYFWESTSNTTSEGNCLGLIASLSSPGIVNGIKTLVFVGSAASGTGYRYAFDFRNSPLVYAYRIGTGSNPTLGSTGGASITVENGIVSAYFTTSTAARAFVGQKNDQTEAWPAGIFRAEAYSTVLSPSQITAAIERMKATL